MHLFTLFASECKNNSLVYNHLSLCTCLFDYHLTFPNIVLKQICWLSINSISRCKHCENAEPTLGGLICCCLSRESAKKRTVNVNSRRYQRFNLSIVSLNPEGSARVVTLVQPARVTLLNLLLCGEHEERSWTKVRNGSFCVRAAVLWADVWVMSDWMGTTGEQVNIRWTLPLCCIYSVSHLTVRPCDQSDCMGVCVCLYVCVCVCMCGIPYVTKCPCKYSNTSTFCPCGDIFKVPMRKQAYKN